MTRAIVPPALHSRGMIYQLGTAKKKLAETRVRSQASLPCPSVVVSCSSRDRAEKGGQKDRGKPERGGGLDTSHPMEVSNHFQLHS